MLVPLTIHYAPTVTRPAAVAALVLCVAGSVAMTLRRKAV
jgi:hypothetical protein